MSGWATQNEFKWDLWMFLFIYFVPHFYFLGFLSYYYSLDCMFLFTFCVLVYVLVSYHFLYFFKERERENSWSFAVGVSGRISGNDKT